MQTAPIAELPETLQKPATTIERRRPGRVEFRNQALIELLRRAIPDPGEADVASLVPARQAAQAAVPAGQGRQDFTITNFDRIRPRPGDPRSVASPVAGQSKPVEFDVARAQQYCRDDRKWLEWTKLLAAEVGQFQSFLTSSDYPKTVPTRDSINALIARLVSESALARRLCLISGRDGTPQANRAVTQAICSLGSQKRVPGEHSYWSDLRALGASLCFYWAMAGAIVRHDYTTIRTIMHAPIVRNDEEVPLVLALPPLALGSIDWNILSGLEARRTPASDFLFNLFKTEIADAALDPGEPHEDLFDRLELLISLEFSHLRLEQIATSSRRLWFWVPLGRYVCSPHVHHRLGLHEHLPADHSILRAGLLGGTPDSAARAAVAMRESFTAGRHSLIS